MDTANDAASHGAEAQPAWGEASRIQFTGRASEYFGIWIVNLILSILTLGIYSAWAKVRSTSYFHSNTIILGDRLVYHATGKMILKGRLIAGAVILAIVVLGQVNPIAQLVATLALLPFYPWILNKALKFHTRMTSWRNVRFDWHGTYWPAFRIIVLWPFAILLSLGLLAPFASRALHRFLAENLTLGTTPFDASFSLRPYYKALFTTFGVCVLALLAVFVVAVVVFSIGDTADTVDSAANFIPIIYTVFFAIYFLMIFGGICYNVLTRNIFFNALTLRGAAAFESDLKVGRTIWITFSNLVVTVATVFLMHPWARIRMTRYVTERVTVKPFAELPDFDDSRRRERSAFGEELGSMEGIDISI